MEGLARRKSRGALVVLIATVVAGVFVFAAAGSSSKVQTIGMALIGPKNDKSFSQARVEGAQMAVKANPTLLKLGAILENRTTDQQRTRAIETLAPLVDIIVGVSASFGPVFDVEAPKFPTKSFVTIAGYPAKYHKNVYSYVVDPGAPAFVAGAIAATMSKSNVVGYVGGYEIPPTTQAGAGFAAGAKFIKPKIKVLSNIIGDFNDVAKAKQATAAMITDGADVIFPYLDAGIAGSYAAGKESGKNPAMFKLTIPDCNAYPNMVGTQTDNGQLSTARLLSKLAHGTLKPTAIFTTLQDPALQALTLCPKFAKNPVIAGVKKKITAGINSGKIKLPAGVINARPKYPYQEGFQGKIMNANKTG